MTIKQFVSLFVAICGFSSIALSQWRPIESGTLAWLHAVHFVNESKGWIGGSNGTLLSTKDSGETWDKERFPSSDTIRDIAFQGNLKGWLLCERGQFRFEKGIKRSYLMRTEDGGLNWKVVEFKSTPELMTRLMFTKSGEGYAIGEGGVITELPDGERQEKRLGLPIKYLMLDGAAFEKDRFILVGGGGTIISSSGPAMDWHEAKFKGARPEVKLNALALIDDKFGCVVGNNGVVITSKDAGKTWGSEASGTSANLLDVLFLDDVRGFVAGENGIILRTSDAGKSWTLEQRRSKHRLERLALAGGKLFAIGFGGTILAKNISAELGNGNKR